MRRRRLIIILSVVAAGRRRYIVTTWRRVVVRMGITRRWPGIVHMARSSPEIALVCEVIPVVGGGFGECPLPELELRDGLDVGLAYAG